MSSKLVLLALVGACATVACQNKQAEKPANTTAASSNNGTRDLKSNPSIATAVSQSKPSQLASSVKALDISQAHDINLDKDLDYFTPLFIAKTPRKMTDEDKLKLLSEEYNNEADTFKKRDLATQLLLKLQQQVSLYKGDYIAKIPIITDDKTANNFLKQQTDKNLSVLSVNAFGIDATKPYNFTTKAFAMSCELDKFLSHGKYGGLGPFFGNKRFIKLDFLRYMQDSQRLVVAEPQEKCELVVPDEQVAKKIEAARANNSMGGKGEIYVQITADNNTLIAKPLYATISYFDTKTDETLATKNFHW